MSNDRLNIRIKRTHPARGVGGFGSTGGVEVELQLRMETAERVLRGEE